MAHIPYGYRIERGRAVVVPEEAEKIRKFYTAYLDGLSIKNAGAAAEIPLSTATLRKMLENELYLGTDYYPPIIDRDTFDEVQRDRAIRTHEGQTKPPQITPIRTRFKMDAPDRTDAGWMSAVDVATYLYSLIQPCDKGHAIMAAEEKAVANAWREQAQTAM